MNMSQEMCRICLSTSNLTPLFTNLFDDEKFIEFLCLLTGLEIKINDSMPQKICTKCKLCIGKASSLRVKSQQSYQKLLKMGFGTADCREFKDSIVKSEYNYDGDYMFFDDCDGTPVKPEVKTKTPTKIKKELKNKIKKTKNITDKCNFGKILLHLKKDKKCDTEKKIVEENDVSKSYLDDEMNIVEDTKEKGPSRKDSREKYLKLVKGTFDPDGPVQCKICNKTVSKWACFISHVRIHLGINILCEHCGKKFHNNHARRRHCRSQHGMERVLCCQYCSFRAIDTTKLKHHTRREHTGERPYICDYCSASYYSRRCLIQHIDSHLPTSTIQCEQCPLFFKSRRHLSRHKFQAHTCKMYMYQCPMCPKIYKSVKYARVHLRKIHSLSAREHKIIKIKL